MLKSMKTAYPLEKEKEKYINMPGQKCFFHMEEVNSTLSQDTKTL